MDYVCRNIEGHVREFRPNMFYFNKLKRQDLPKCLLESVLKKETCSLKIKDAGTLPRESLHVIAGNLIVRSR